MKIDQRVRDHVQGLIVRGLAMASTPSESADAALDAQCEGWLASARNAIGSLCSDMLGAYPQQFRLVLIGGSAREKVGKASRILEALLVDIEAGMVGRLVDAARLEVFGDLLTQADHYLRGNKPALAGVLAGVVFEDTIRQCCDRIGIPQKNVELEQLISGLAKREKLTHLEATRARSAAALRNKATHAQWDEFVKSDVEATLVFTRVLIDRFFA